MRFQKILNPVFAENFSCISHREIRNSLPLYKLGTSWTSPFEQDNFKELSVFSANYISGGRSRLHQNSLWNGISIGDADGFAYCIVGRYTIVYNLSNFLFTKSRANDLGKMQSSQSPSLEFSLDKDLHCKLCSMQTMYTHR